MRRMKKRKGIEAQGVKPPIPFRVNYALIGDEEQNRKQKKDKQGADPQPSYMDHSVASYNLHGLYGGSFLF